MDSLTRKFLKYKKFLREKITFVIQIFGLLLIYLGEKIIGVKMKYRLVSSIIESVFQSNDILVRVEGITLHPLFVRFKLKVSVPKR